MKSLILIYGMLFTICRASAADKATLSIVVPDSYARINAAVELQDFMSKSLAREDIQIRYVTYPVGRGTAVVEKGEADGEILRDTSAVEKSQSLARTNQPLLISKVKILYLKSNPKFSSDKLQNYAGATFLNSNNIIEKAQKDRIKLAEVQSDEQISSMFQKNRLDYFLILEEMVPDLFSKYSELKDTLAIAHKPFMVLELFPVYHKKHKPLLPRIEKALRAGIKNDLDKYPHLKDVVNRNF